MKKDFIVRRSITMVEGKPHVETYSEQELVRCNECKHGDPCNGGEIYCEKDIGTIETAVHKPEWFCADGERRTDNA